MAWWIVGCVVVRSPSCIWRCASRASSRMSTGAALRVVTESGAVHDFALTTYGGKSATGVRLLLNPLR